MCSILRVEGGGGGTGLTTVSTNMARHNPCLMDITRNSPAAEIAKRLMPLDEARYFYNQLFIKDPGTQDIDLQVGNYLLTTTFFQSPCTPATALSGPYSAATSKGWVTTSSSASIAGGRQKVGSSCSTWIMASSSFRP